MDCYLLRRGVRMCEQTQGFTTQGLTTQGLTSQIGLDLPKCAAQPLVAQPVLLKCGAQNTQAGE